MNIGFILLASAFFSPLVIFLFFRELLDNKKSWKTIVLVTAIVAVIGLILTFEHIGSKKMNFSVCLIFPLISIGIYRPIYNLFAKKLNRPPSDTTHNWERGLFWDRLFNIAYFFLITIFAGILTLVLASSLK